MSIIARWLAVFAEALVAFVAGALALIFLADAVFGVIQADWSLTIFALVFFAPLSSIAMRGARSVRKMSSGEAAPATFFSWDWNSGFSFLLLTTICGTLGSIAWTDREKIIELGRNQEAIEFMNALKNAQTERHKQRGSFAKNIAELHAVSPKLLCFDVGPIGIDKNSPERWMISLSRNERCKLSPYVGWRYGSYRITFDSSRSPEIDCEGARNPAICRADLLRQPRN